MASKSVTGRWCELYPDQERRGRIVTVAEIYDYEHSDEVPFDIWEGPDAIIRKRVEDIYPGIEYRESSNADEEKGCSVIDFDAMLGVEAKSRAGATEMIMDACEEHGIAVCLFEPGTLKAKGQKKEKPMDGEQAQNALLHYGYLRGLALRATSALDDDDRRVLNSAAETIWNSIPEEHRVHVHTEIRKVPEMTTPEPKPDVLYWTAAGMRTGGGIGRYVSERDYILLKERLREARHREWHYLLALEESGIDSSAMRQAQCVDGDDCEFWQQEALNEPG